MTDHRPEVREALEFTFLKPCIVENEPDAHTVWLKVGPQEFCVSSIACETKEEAEWMRLMLAKAIVALWQHRSAPPIEPVGMREATEKLVREDG